MSNVDIAPSAHKHGVVAADMIHAVRYPIAVVPGRNEVVLYLGAACDGAPLEVGVVLGDPPRIIHAMPLRNSLYRYLRPSGD